MPTARESWEAYFYPDTFNPRLGQGVLRNLFDEHDPQVLRELEFGATFRRHYELALDPTIVTPTYDAAHLRAIHAHLFQDVYDWAGEYRSVNMAKGAPGGFANVEAGEIDRYLADAHRIVLATEWPRLERDEFVRASAKVFAYVNQAHPFREGNGRAAKVFMAQVAEQSRFAFEFERVAVPEWNQASMYSGPNLGAYEPHPEELTEVFGRASVERTL